MNNLRMNKLNKISWDLYEENWKASFRNLKEMKTRENNITMLNVFQINGIVIVYLALYTNF